MQGKIKEKIKEAESLLTSIFLEDMPSATPLAGAGDHGVTSADIPIFQHIPLDLHPKKKKHKTVKAMSGTLTDNKGK